MQKKSKSRHVFYGRIQELRSKNNLTQQAVADSLGSQREVYRRYEKGERDLPLKTAMKLADLYEVSLDYLVGRTGYSE